MTTFIFNGKCYQILSCGTVFVTDNMGTRKLADKGIATSQVNAIVLDGLYRNMSLTKNKTRIDKGQK